VSDVITFCGRSSAFSWHNEFVIKLLQSDVFVSIDQRIINECYIHIFSQYLFFSCDLDFNPFNFIRRISQLHHLLDELVECLTSELVVIVNGVKVPL